MEEQRKPSKILALDPGKRCGFAEIEYGGHVLNVGVVQFEDLPSFLEKLDRTGLTCLVYESYRVLRHKAQAHTGSVLEAAQCIGVVKAYSQLHHIRTKEQQPSVRKAGAAYLQVNMGRGHTPDEISALCHGVAYLKSIGQFKTALERKLNDGKNKDDTGSAGSV